MGAMRIGINGSSLIALGRPTREIVDHAVAAEAAGLSSYWLAQLAVPDAFTVLALVADATERIELGTAVVPIWTRHPLMLAGQVLTVADVAGPRLIVGLGLAHRSTVESTLGIPFDRPARTMDEYLSVLLPALTDRRVDVTGEIWSGHAEALAGPADVPTPSVMVAAMGPRMLEITGGRTDGSILWLSGPRTIETSIRPALERAARAAGRPTPRIVASVPVCVTDRPDDHRTLVAGMLAGYNDLPSYRSVMDLEGASGPEDVSLIGDEATVRAGLDRFAEAGATDFAALEFVLSPEDETRTRALLVDWQRQHNG
jgi:F420-dependent oxidoreductase-like protein